MSDLGLISGLRLKGEIINGVCVADYTVSFHNKTEELMEASFKYPFPPSCCPTKFSATFNGVTKTSTIAHSDDSRLIYDDTLASNDFGVITQLTEDGRTRVDCGCLKKGEKCDVTVSFVTTLTHFQNSLLLIFPAILKAESQHKITYDMAFVIRDVFKIKEISTMNVRSLIKFRNDNHDALVCSTNVPVTSPLRLFISYEIPPSRCICDYFDGSSYLFLSSKAPLAVRTQHSDFTVMIEQGGGFSATIMSSLLRAIELFVLSIPNGCSVNVIRFGDRFESLFDSPVLISAAVRQQASEYVRMSAMPESLSSERVMFDQAASMCKFGKNNPAVVVVGSNFRCGTVEGGEKFIFVDPLHYGDTREFAARIGASYVAVPNQEGFFAAILSAIKMTATPPIADAVIEVNGQKTDLGPVLPSVVFERTFCIEESKVNSIKTVFGDAVDEVPVVGDKSGSVRFIWALSELRNGDSDDINALMPPDGGVARFERDEDLNGNVTFVEAEIESLYQSPKPHPRTLWIQQQSTPLQQQQMHQQYQMYQQPQQYSFRNLSASLHERNYIAPVMQDYSNMNFPQQQRMKRQGRAVTMSHWESSAIFSMPQQPTKQQMSTRFYNGNFIPRKPKQANQKKDAEVFAEKVETVKVLSKPVKKPMFFLLRLLQSQEEDGSWRSQEKISCCVGAQIPESFGEFSEELFLTAFCVAALINKAAKDKDKWEILAEKAMLFLEESNQKTDWPTVIESLKIHFVK